MVLRTLCLTAIAFLSLHCVARAQDDRLPGGVAGQVRLLNDNAVARELALDKRQRAGAAALAKEINGKDDKDLLAAVGVRLSETLASNQLERLNQIHWRKLGGRALHEAKVAEALEITGEQKKALAKAAGVNETEHKKMLDFLRRARFRSREAMEKYKQGFRDEADKRLFAVLDKKQRKQFDELLGKPFPAKKKS